jgi:excisionase family DNA binding protein
MENKNNNHRKFMTAKEVSEFLRIPLSTVYGLSQKGVLRGKKVGKHWRYLEEEIVGLFVPGEALAAAVSALEEEGSEKKQELAPELVVRRILRTPGNPSIGEHVNVICRIPGSDEHVTVELKGRVIEHRLEEGAEICD